MLHGRRAECDALDRLLADARRSRSGVLVLRGEAGAGKSALLDHAAGRAEGMAVLRASGVESEAELPFAALHQLLRPLRELAGRLPGPQEAALPAPSASASPRRAERAGGPGGSWVGPELDLLLVVSGLVIVQFAKAWYIDRMVLLFEDMKGRHPEYARWEH
jgi:AAA ATPase domain